MILRFPNYEPIFLLIIIIFFFTMKSKTSKIDFIYLFIEEV